MMNHAESKQPLGEIPPNIGSVFQKNCRIFGDNSAFAQRINGVYHYYSWNRLGLDLSDFSEFLKNEGLSFQDRVALVTQNSYLRLVAEMSLLVSGMVGVPIFLGYSPGMIDRLVGFSDVKMLILEDETLLSRLDVNRLPEKLVLLNRPKEPLRLKDTRVLYIEDLISEEEEERRFEPETLNPFAREIRGDDAALILFTSGTSNFPKGVVLTHRNLLSQQKALEILWETAPGGRFLCYLPWHHSFGGLFERFFALYSGGCLAVDDSKGKDIDQLLKNFHEIKPQIYFSVPKVYQEIVSRTLVSKKADELFFHDELKFVFTAAAPLTASISDVFKKKKIPVIEGWGLTETSPCCSLTNLSLKREPGVVGFPIPGVQIREIEGEIQVKGPNVMREYFKNPTQTSEVLDEDGWFKTGDLGEITKKGLKIISRKDRMFKLNNGEKIFPSVIEEQIMTHCIYIKNIFVFGSGQKQPLALIFPNLELLTAGILCEDKDKKCAYPDSYGHFKDCLETCFQRYNQQVPRKFERIGRAVLIEDQLSLEKGDLTPSMKVVPRSLEKNYRQYLDCLLDGQNEAVPKNGHLVVMDLS